MKGLLLLTGTNSLMYCACTSIIRCIYVRSSLQENVQRVLKRNSFTMSFLVFGVFYNIFLLSVFIYEQKDRTGIDRLSLVMYRACVDPWAEWSTPLIQAYPVMMFLMYGMNIVNLSCNFYLFLYLEDQRKSNKGSMKTELKVQSITLRYSFISTDTNRHEEREEKEPIAS